MGVTDRHFRRVFQAVHGVTPMDWLATQRLLLAKRLLTDTQLPVIEVASASGFASLRRFNAAFAERYRLAPSALRRSAAATGAGADPSVLRLSWRPPYDSAAMHAFLAARPLAGVEAADGPAWRRTLSLTVRGQTCTGWLALAFDDERHGVRLSVSPGLAPALGAVVERVRHLLDLDADPAAIDPVLAALPFAPRPGLRVPGCIDGFETTVRIILGQQVSVAAACTLAGRLVERFGAPIDTPFPGLTRLFPSASRLAEASAESIGTLGIVRARVAALQALARAVCDGTLALHPAAPLEATRAALLALPGVGDWTAELVALRVLAWPDAFPATDAGVVKALGGLRAPASTRPVTGLAALALLRGDATLATPGRPAHTAPLKGTLMTRLSERPWVAQARLDTPLGPVTLAATAQGLGGLWFDAQAHHPGPLAAPWQPEHRLLARAAAELKAYWRQPATARFSVPLDLGGTAFQQAVWAALRELPCGATTVYGALARRIGRPRAVRALGAAVGRNPVSIIVPCHRVVGHDGALTGYAGGLPRKAALAGSRGRPAPGRGGPDCRTATLSA